MSGQGVAGAKIRESRLQSPNRMKIAVFGQFAESCPLWTQMNTIGYHAFYERSLNSPTARVRQKASRRWSLLSDSEVVREGLRLLQEETEWKAEVRRKISEGMLQARAGKVVDGSKALESVLKGLDA